MEKSREEIRQMKFHHTYDLRGLLMPWLRFRAQIVFKPSHDHGTSSTRTLTCYGDEHDCTYKQCLAGHVKAIILDRVKGYEALMGYIEGPKCRNKIVSATIYGRSSPDSKLFDLTHRHYDSKGKLVSGDTIVGDPVIEDIERYKQLDYKIDNGLLVIVEPTLLTSNTIHDNH
jgi:hypothetical protein